MSNAQRTKVTMYCVESGVIRKVDRKSAMIVREARTLAEEDQCRLLKVLRHMAAKTWPYSLRETKSLRPDRVRGVVDKLPEPPVVHIA